MRFLLLPLTLFLWYTIVYYSTYYLIVASLLLFSLSWYWILFVMPFLTAFTWFLITLIPILVQNLFGWIYYGNKLARDLRSPVISGLHSIVSLLALISLVMLFYENPITIVSGNEEIGVFKGLWDAAPIKFLFLAPFVIAIFLGQFYAQIIAPFILFPLKSKD